MRAKKLQIQGRLRRCAPPKLTNSVQTTGGHGEAGAAGQNASAPVAPLAAPSTEVMIGKQAWDGGLSELLGPDMQSIHSLSVPSALSGVPVEQWEEELERLRIRKDERKTAFRRTRARSEAQDLLRAQDDYARSKRFLSQVCERVERV